MWSQSLFHLTGKQRKYFSQCFKLARQAKVLLPVTIEAELAECFIHRQFKEPAGFDSGEECFVFEFQVGSLKFEYVCENCAGVAAYARFGDGRFGNILNQ
jgi:hypothetical protein